MGDTCYEMIQRQCAMEAHASRVYLSMALWCDNRSYVGSAKFLKASSEEEAGHEIKFLSFLNDYADILPDVPAVERAAEEPGSLYELFDKVLQMEMAVTVAIQKIARTAVEEGDMEIYAFLVGFLTDQVESVSEVRMILRKLQEADGDTAATHLADEWIGTL